MGYCAFACALWKELLVVTQLCRIGHAARRVVLALVSLGAGLVTMAEPSSAQVYVGGLPPSVVVDFSVLDQLGPPADLPNSLIPGVRSAGREATPLGRSPFLQRGSASRAAPSLSRKVPFLSRREAAPSRREVTLSRREAATFDEAPLPRKASPGSMKKPAASKLKPPPTEERMPDPVESAAQQTANAGSPNDEPRAEPLDAGDLVVNRKHVAKQTGETTARTEEPPPARSAKPREVEPKPPVREVEPPPAPPRIAAPEKEPAPQQVASLPPPAPPPIPPSVPEASAPPVTRGTPPAVSAPTGGDALTIGFANNVSKLPEDGKAELRVLADRMNHEQGMKIHLLAYAAGDDSNPSQARRLSLSRALEVRAFLIDQGIPASRVEVKALGHRVPSGPADRVDVSVSQR